MVLAALASGLANRIKGLVTARRVAREMGLPLKVYWERNEAVTSDLSSLFPGQFECVSPEEYRELAVDPSVLSVRTWRLWPARSDRFPEGYRPTYPSPHRNGIDFAYGAVPPAVREAFLEVFRDLGPHGEVAAAVEGIVGDCTNLDTGMAVRTWVDAPERQKLFDRRAVEAAIDAAEGPIFVTSDSRKLVDDLARRWPDRVVTSTAHVAGLVGDQRVLCDMLAVARCSRMWISLGSTFSEVAWWLGGARAEVRMLEPRGYALQVLDLGEVAAYGLAGRWWFKNKSRFDARVAGAWKRLTR